MSISFEAYMRTFFRAVPCTLLLGFSIQAFSLAIPVANDAQFDDHQRRRDPIAIEQEHKLEKLRSEDRYRQLKRDAEKLLETATELKQYVDKAGENVLSLEVIRKAEMMEKLSKDLRSRMKGN